MHQNKNSTLQKEPDWQPEQTTGGLIDVQDLLLGAWQTELRAQKQNKPLHSCQNMAAYILVHNTNTNK